jgi:hypothetical protein
MNPVDFRKDRCGAEPVPRVQRETPMLPTILRANKAIGHYWFEHDPVRVYRRETKLLGGRYWVESSWNYDGTKREYLAVAADPNGGIGYPAPNDSPRSRKPLPLSTRF